MSHQLQQRLQKRFTTAARVKDRVSYFRIVNRVRVRNLVGDLVIDQAFDKSFSAERYINGGGNMYVEIYRDVVVRKHK